MARLRKEEEERQYERMTAASEPRFPMTSIQIGAKHTDSEDDVTYDDVKRQVMLIINVLISIFACAVALWMLAWHWPTPSRLALSMTAGGAVGIAEVVVYAVFIGRLKDAKIKERKRPERKTIEKSWIIDALDGGSGTAPKAAPNKEISATLRRRQR